MVSGNMVYICMEITPTNSSLVAGECTGDFLPPLVLWKQKSKTGHESDLK